MVRCSDTIRKFNVFPRIIRRRKNVQNDVIKSDHPYFLPSINYKQILKGKLKMS
jgi:hypothetical protein